MSNPSSVILTFPDAPTDAGASIAYRRMWSWIRFRLIGRPQKDLLCVLHALTKISLGAFKEPTRMPVGNYAHLFVQKLHNTFNEDEVAQMQILRAVTADRLVRNLDWTKYPLTDKERRDYGQLINMVLDGINRDSYIVNMTTAELRMMMRELLDIAVDEYGLTIEDGAELGLEPAL